ncbi:MAG TPA: 3-deoxy-7-phosphoheptulonate synthase [Polyangia bacterium]|jgi:3-deoxy-7-phosphoheptulonate synthase|nr:3-deoxy-7-phosphoheptulonate synthase [Polyangia bacterium]
MLILMKADASKLDVGAVEAKIRELGFTPNEIPGSTRLAIGITGNQGPLDPGIFNVMSGVADAVPVSKPWKLVSREVKPDDTFVKIGSAQLGGGKFGIIAGPCAVESREQLNAAARAVKASGAHFLRGGAFKPRTSPYSFQGMKEDGLKILADARAETGLPIVTEVMDTRDVELVAKYADVLQVGARNMQNFSLLEAVGSQPRAVMLKRGLSATIQEFLMAAEYIVKQGNYNVILCERGIRTFETMTRNTLDLGSIPLIKRLTHLPIIVDPSHGTGDRASVPAMARAALALGADGLMVEVHPNPEKALSDGPQSLTPEGFERLMETLRAIAPVVGLEI